MALRCAKISKKNQIKRRSNERGRRDQRRRRSNGLTIGVNMYKNSKKCKNKQYAIMAREVNEDIKAMGSLSGCWYPSLVSLDLRTNNTTINNAQTTIKTNRDDSGFTLFKVGIVGWIVTQSSLVCVCVCACFLPFILNIKFVGRTSRGHTGGSSHRIFHPPFFCGACLNFLAEGFSHSFPSLTVKSNFVY